MALKVVHLLALLILGYFGVTLEVYWILDSHSSNAAQVSGRPNEGVSNDAHTSDALGTVAKPVAAASLLRGKPKGAVEQELVKKFAKVNPVKPVEAKVGPPHSRQQNQDRNESSAPALLVEQSRRFPEYGTSEYFAMCPYMEKSALPPPSTEGCALIIHPRPDSNEGLAAWASGVVQGHLITRATGCRFMFDYGPGVAIETLITPPSQSLNNDDWPSLVCNWAIPPNFQCEREKCMDLKSETLQTKRLMSVFRHRYDKSPMHDVPEYRYSYVGISSRFNATQFDYLQSYLPGWDVRLGAACSMQLLFQPSKAIIKYQPNFYIDILPRLRDEKTLVMALYVRVGFADKAAVAEKKGTEPVEVMKGRPQKTVKALSLCSTAMEEEILATKKGRYVRQCLISSQVISRCTYSLNFNFAYRTTLTVPYCS